MGGSFGGGLARGLAGGIQQAQQLQLQHQQQALQTELAELKKKEIKEEANLRQTKVDILSKLPPEEQAKALFPGLAKENTMEADLAAIQKIFGGGGTEQQGSPGIAPQSSMAPQPPANLADQIAYWKNYYPQTEKLPDNVVMNWINTESKFNPNAVSPKGAMGLTQLMPGTQKDMAVSNPYDPNENLRGGFGYLNQQIERFKDPRLALAAYNAGPEAVAKHGGIPPYPETQGYVQKVLGGQGRQSGGVLSGLTAEDFVRGILKKKYGVESDEWSPMKGVAGPGGRPYVVPFNKRLKSFDWSSAVPESVEPKMIQQENQLGGTQQLPTDPFTGQPTAPAIPTKPGGMKPEQAGKQNVIMQAQDKLSEINEMIFAKGDVQTGKVNTKIFWEAKGGLGEGSILWSKMNQAVWGALRPESGALVSKEEIAQSFQNYMPTVLDLAHPKRDKIVREKMKDFNQYIKGLAALTDPTEQLAYIRRSTTGSGPSLDLGKGKKKDPVAEADEWLKGEVGK